MRIYEFAKTIGLPNKEILDLLNKGGFKVASHMSVLTEPAQAYLEKTLKQIASKNTEKTKVVAQPQKATKVTPEAVQKMQETPLKPTVSPKPAEPVKPVPVVAQQPAPRAPYRPAHTQQRSRYAPVQQTPTPRPQPVAPVAVPPPTSIEVHPMTVEQFAQKIHKSLSELIITLLKKGVRATKNEMLQEKVIADVARHFSIEPIFPSKKELAPVIEKRVTAVSTEPMIERMPVIVVMGHVDHGKTSLLDYIRKSRLASREKGGITQHLGAYEVKTAHGGIVFLDTPGHQAFSHMRIRGTKAADIAVLVIAADDSIKPQTVEAINIAQATDIPIVVAINKIDKVAPERVDVVKRDCAKYNLIPEEWGGTTIFVPLSAKTGAGVDSLLEILALQAQVMELKADPTVPGKGFILESKVEKGRGSVATVICQEGSVKVGDFFVSGATQGKITSMINSLGQRVEKALPSHPVQISGFEELPAVGDSFAVVAEQEYRKARTNDSARVTTSKQTARENAINFIVKAEGSASLEAVLGGLKGLADKDDKELYIVSSGVGAITEGDVMLAGTTGASIIGLHVKPEANAATMATRLGVKIELYEIIYQLFDALKLSIKGIKEVVKVKQKIGEVSVRKVFAIKGVGVIAGCYVKDGKITRDSSVVIWRGRDKVGEGKIESLQRDRKTVKEIQQGFECAFMIKGFEDWQVDDRADVYLEVAQPAA